MLPKEETIQWFLFSGYQFSSQVESSRVVPSGVHLPETCLPVATPKEYVFIFIVLYCAHTWNFRKLLTYRKCLLAFDPVFSLSNNKSNLDWDGQRGGRREKRLTLLPEFSSCVSIVDKKERREGYLCVLFMVLSSWRSTENRLIHTSIYQWCVSGRVTQILRVIIKIKYWIDRWLREGERERKTELTKAHQKRTSRKTFRKIHIHAKTVPTHETTHTLELCECQITIILAIYSPIFVCSFHSH